MLKFISQYPVLVGCMMIILISAGVVFWVCGIAQKAKDESDQEELGDGYSTLPESSEETPTRNSPSTTPRDAA
jgi:hypothetical protein